MTASLTDRLQNALGTAFRIERELGGGGMSHVFIAEETALGRRVVIKVLPPELAAGVSADRFRREIQMAAQLQHPGIVPVLTAGAQDDVLWYAMPYVEGESLRTRLARGPLPIDEAVRLWRDLLEALEYAQGRGIVHRDIKPENIMLTGRRAVTLDFGVAKAVSASTGVSGATMTGVGLAIGTPAYMAPEQAAGDGSVDGRADLYAAGLVMYEMLAGRGPFDARTPTELMAAHIATVPPSIVTYRNEVSADVAAVIMSCLAKNPNERPSSAAAVLAKLDSITVTSGTSPVASGVRSPRALTFAAVALLTVATSFGIFFKNRGTTDAPSAAKLTTLADSSRLGIAFLPVVAERQDSLLARTIVSAQIKSLQSDRRIVLRTPDQIASIVASLDYPATQSVDSLKQLIRDLGVNAYVVHTIARTPNGTLLVAEGYASRNDSVLFRVEASANSAADFTGATATLTSATLAGALRNVGKVPPPQVSGRLFGTSPDAARLFVEAQEYFGRRDYVTVAKKLRLALGIDSNFVMGWHMLGAALGNGNLSVDERLRAEREGYRLRDHNPSKAVRFFQEAVYLRVIGDLNGAMTVTKEALRRFPNNFVIRNEQGLIYRALREDELAERTFAVIADDELERRQMIVGVTNYSAALLKLGKLSEARALSRRADSLVGRMTVNAIGVRNNIALAIMDVDSIAQNARDRLTVASGELTRLPGYTILRSAMALAGRIDSATALETKRRAITREQDIGRLSAQSVAFEALWRAAFVGDRAHAAAMLDSGLASVKWSSLPALDKSYAEVIDARLAAGQIAEARRDVDAWQRDVPSDFARAQRPLIETARGEIALAEGKASEALSHFRAGDVGQCASCVYPRLARAFDALKQQDSTIYWYEKYLSTPTFDVNLEFRERARAFRRLGELYEAKGDTKRALQRYGDFVDLWKNADAALQPAVKDARDRIAKLQKRSG